MAVAPYAAASEQPTPIRIKTAIFMTLRNEDAARAIQRFKIVKDSVEQTGEGAAFSYFVLSDSNDGAVAAAEEAAVAAWKAAARASDASVYRRRSNNIGYKAGNVRDFCARWGDQFELMLPLDADSLMAARDRAHGAHDAGASEDRHPAEPRGRHAVGERFCPHFPVRHAPRDAGLHHGSGLVGGDCGPFWGHNALVRIEPFHDECDLPLLPGKPPLGGHVLSHDQVEATLMRRAGYEVRVLPEEVGSWEENPPTMLEFTRRDVRWCQGNMQYFKLLDLPGL